MSYIIALSPKGKAQDFGTLADKKKKAPRYRKCGDWGMRQE